MNYAPAVEKCNFWFLFSILKLELSSMDSVHNYFTQHFDALSLGHAAGTKTRLLRQYLSKNLDPHQPWLPNLRSM